jgi:type II secretory pathway component PulM
MPALPLGDAGPYVAAAYLVFLALILVYVGIMASKLVRIERQAAELNELVARRDRGSLDLGARDAGAAESAAGEPGPLDARHRDPVERA